MAPNHIDFPFHFDVHGRSAPTTLDDHVRDLIMQTLFTEPGERVMRPDFGCSLKQLVFLPNSDALQSASQQIIQGALQRFLGELIAVERVEVRNADERLEIKVVYRRRDTGERREDSFLSVLAA